MQIHLTLTLVESKAILMRWPKGQVDATYCDRKPYPNSTKWLRRHILDWNISWHKDWSVTSRGASPVPFPCHKAHKHILETFDRDPWKGPQGVGWVSGKGCILDYSHLREQQSPFCPISPSNFKFNSVRLRGALRGSPTLMIISQIDLVSRIMLGFFE